MAIQLGTGNQLIITIPSQGDLNWAASFQTNFAQKIVEHDHTGSGSGEKIGQNALVSIDDVNAGAATDVAVHTRHIKDNAITQDKIASGAVSTTELSTDVNTTLSNVSALDTRLTTAESNITSNDTDIAALDTRLTTAENNKITATEAQALIDAGGFLDTAEITTLIQSTDLTDLSNIDSNMTPANGDILTYNTTTSKWESTAPSDNSVIEINNATDVAAIANTTLKNAIVRINYGGTISNVVFENCTIGIDSFITFSGCTLTGCSVREADQAAMPWSITFNTSCNLWGVEIYGMGSCNILSSNVVGLTISHTNSVSIESCSNLQRLNITARSLTIKNEAPFIHSAITVLDYVRIEAATADNQISFQDSIITTPHIYSQTSYSIQVDPDSSINVEDSYTTGGFPSAFYLKIVNTLGVTLINKNVSTNTLLHNPFKIREGQLISEVRGEERIVLFESGQTTVPSSGSWNLLSSPVQFDDISATHSSSNGTVTINKDGFYNIAAVAWIHLGSGTLPEISLSIYKGPNILFNTSIPGQNNISNVPVWLVSGDTLSVYMQHTSNSSQTIDYSCMLKKILY